MKFIERFWSVDVKTRVTITLVYVFAILSLLGRINQEQFMTIFTVIISFYFGTQYQKKVGEKDEGKSE